MLFDFLHDNISTITDLGMGATALYMCRQLNVTVRALTTAVVTIKADHVNHEGRLQALEKAA